jgi:hypothetical protein
LNNIDFVIDFNIIFNTKRQVLHTAQGNLNQVPLLVKVALPSVLHERCVAFHMRLGTNGEPAQRLAAQGIQREGLAG